MLGLGFFHFFLQRVLVLKFLISNSGLENAIFHLDSLNKKIKIIKNGVFPIIEIFW